MIELLHRKEVQDFLVENEQEDEKKLILKQRTLFDIPSSIIANQIIGRRKAKSKLPLYYSTRGIVYPPGINVEQSSSEKTALFKADLLNGILSKKNTLVDLTGGFGVDSFFLKGIFDTVHFVEPNASLLSFAQHNHKTLGVDSIHYHHSTAEQFLDTFNEKLDCVFLDPSRRSKTNQKVFRLSDCEPNAASLLSQIFEVCEFALIKASPLLDIHQGIQELSHVEKVWVVSIENECKEVLFLCHKGYEAEPTIVTVNLQEGQCDFSFTLQEEKNCVPSFSAPLSYLYEPNTSILKASAFKLIGVKFSLQKLHPSTHLYTSNELIQNFPGRIFKIITFVKSDRKSMKEIFPEGKANVITRNYPLSVDELKKKTKLRDGSELYLIGFSGKDEKYLVAANRLK